MSGSVDGFAGATPTAQTQDPLYQKQAARYAQMTQEQLQEAALRLQGSPQGQMVQRMLQQRRVMSAQQPAAQQQQQAPAAPLDYAEGGAIDPSGPPRAFGLGGPLLKNGGVRMAQHSLPMGGFLHTAGPGRMDNLNINPHADSYVLPADVVSGLGQGNSLAGAKALDMALRTGPGGIPMPTAKHAGHRFGPPKPPGMHGFARGGDTPTVKIVAAGGEYVLTPEECAAIGSGSVKRGHDILDAFCLHVRGRTIKDMRKLKGPVKS
jgi:hypothetical protein